jgi:hypothetical protein|tara:strand:+ start:782 stop:1018 length:237 start_codon:yes stop_codon:yes gene_type:complete
MTLVNMKIWDRPRSQPRAHVNVPLDFARHMAINGGFHRVVITGEWDEVLLEIKTREFTPASCDPRSMALASLREHAKK